MVKKTNSKRIVAKLKRPKCEPVLITFRIDQSVKNEFISLCEHIGIPAAKTVEELMKDFIEQEKR